MAHRQLLGRTASGRSGRSGSSTWRRLQILWSQSWCACCLFEIELIERVSKVKQADTLALTGISGKSGGVHKPDRGIVRPCAPLRKR